MFKNYWMSNSKNSFWGPIKISGQRVDIGTLLIRKNIDPKMKIKDRESLEGDKYKIKVDKKQQSLFNFILSLFEVLWLN